MSATPTTTEAAFVGDGRHAVVAGLLAAFDRIRAGGPAQWIVLEAPSGWGKSRTLRELYARLAAERQEDPPYWPRDILASQDDLPDDVTARRKRLVPEVVHTPGSLPGYLWWGITCSRRGGVASTALRHDLAQVQAHAEYLEDAWRTVSPSRARWAGGLRDAGRAAADEAAMEAAGTAIESVLGAAIPGLGLVRWLGERGVASVRANAERRERLASTERLAASNLVDETASMISRLAVPGLPVVVAVEDLHDADAGLADLLRTLVSGPSSTLVVSTSWPGATTANAHVEHALAALGDRVVRLDHRTRTAPDPFPAEASLAALGADDLASIVRHRFPQVEPSTLAAIVARYPNPLAIELFCQLPRVRRRGRSGALELDAATIASAPAEIRGLYLDLWRELPETVREALSLAALGIPSVIDPSTATEWNTALMLTALEDLGWPALDEIARALHSGGDAYSWARSVTEMLHTFNEPDQREIAADDDSFLFADDRVEVRTALAAALTRYVDGATLDLGPAERNHVADLAAVLYAEGLLTDPDVLADAVRLAAELAFDDQRDLPRVVRLLTEVIDAGPSADRLARAHLLRGHAHLSQGHLGDALADGERAALAPEAPELFELEVLNLRARALTELRRDRAALEAYHDLVARMDAARGVDHPDSIAVRASLGLALSRAGHQDEAVDLARSTTEVAERVLGSDDPVTLALRNSLGVLLSERGRTDEAHSLFVALAADCLVHLGPSHPRTLAVRRNAAWLTFTRGDHAEAVAALRTVATDHHRLLGPRHPETLTAERLLATALASGDDKRAAQEGVDLLTSVHAREVDVLGWDHPDVQRTRRLVADLALSSGDVDLAVTMLERHVRDHERIHGSSSLELHDAQVQLGRALALADRDAEAMACTEAALDGYLALLGDRSERVLVARQLLGRIAAELGDTARAGDEMQGVVEVATQLWGRSDVRTFDARDDLARLLHLTGRAQDALVEWRQMAIDAADALGHDHEVTRNLEQIVREVADDEGS